MRSTPAAASRELNLFGSLRGYQRAWLRPDLVAGVTVWAVLVPESLAYATIAGVPPVVGLYAAVPALLMYAVFGSSRHLVVASMSASAALSFSIVGDFAHAGGDDFVQLTAALAVVTGVIALVAGLARLGFLASFISEPVLKGFIIGLALTIIAGQLPKMFGVSKGEGDFFRELAHLIAQLGNTQAPTLIIGLASLAAVLLIRRRLPLVPGSLVVVLLSILAVSVFNLDAHGVDIVGHIESGLPDVRVPSPPTLQDWLQLAGPAVGLLLVGYAEALGAAKTYAAREGYDIDPNRELIGMGAANVGAGLTSGMVVNGSLSKTAVNGDAGAKSQVSGLAVAGLVLVTLLFLTGLFEKLPEATLAAVVIAAVIELVDIPSLRRLYRVWTGHLGGIYGWAARADFLAAMAALLGVLVFDTLPGLFIGIGVSLLLLLYRSSRPHVARLARGAGGAWLDIERHPGLAPDAEVVVLRVEAGLFFANADRVRATVRAAVADSPLAVVIDAQTAPYIDVTATEMLVQVARDLDRVHVRLGVAHPIGQTRDVLRRAADLNDTTITVYPTIDEAVAELGRTGPPTR